LARGRDESLGTFLIYERQRFDFGYDWHVPKLSFTTAASSVLQVRRSDDAIGSLVIGWQQVFDFGNIHAGANRCAEFARTMRGTCISHPLADTISRSTHAASSRRA